MRNIIILLRGNKLERVIVIRYGEIYLKGKNRDFFEKQLVKNIRNKLKAFECKTVFGRSRYTVTDYNEEQERDIVAALKTVFGIHSISIAYCVPNDYKSISDTAISVAPKSGTFRISAHRGDKHYPITSTVLASRVGGDVLEANPDLTVDLHHPDNTIWIDVRENGTAYVYSEVIDCLGGMPVGCAGKGLLMLSGGIDSPVAGYMMAKRGMCFDALHFHSYPYTSDLAKEKVKKLASIMQNYCGKIRLLCVPVTKIQETIHSKCTDSYMITLLRRFMMRIAEQIAIKQGCGCIINGESLGQVASQTLESITVTNATVKTMPIFRPLIGMDKQEIIDISEKMGTYETSILPYEDCCTVFLPESPITRPTLERVECEEAKIENYDELLREAIDNLEILKIID